MTPQPFATYETKPSRIRRMEDLHTATVSIGSRGFTEYDDSVNPWPVGSFRYERVKRFYEQELDRYRRYEPTFLHLCEVYGYTPPDPKK